MTTKDSARSSLSRPEFIALMAALMGLNALAIDILLPALPYMGEALNVPHENDRQLVISFYMLGFGLTQLIFGPLSDRFGRRAPLLIGLVVYLVAAFAAIFAPSFETLLALRLVQGMGAAGTRVITQSVVRDCYSGRAMAEIMSLVFMVFTIMPIIAPGIGQILLLTGPWWTIFLFMGGLAAIISLWALLRLPETLKPENRRPLTLSVIAQGFVIVATNRISICYALAGAFVFGAMFGFINTSQQIYVGIYGLGAWFPAAFAAVAVLMAFASYLNSRVVSQFGMRRISHAAVIAMTLMAMMLMLVAYLDLASFWVFLGTMGLMMFMFAWAAPNMNALSMEPLGKVAGTASAVFGFIQTVGGSLLGLVIGRMFDGTIIPLALGYAVMGVMAIVLILVAEKGKLFGVSPDYQT